MASSAEAWDHGAGPPRPRPLITHGEGSRCEKFRMHENLKVSKRAICFECMHFDQEVDDEGESAWTLYFDDRGTCAIGRSND